MSKLLIVLGIVLLFALPVAAQETAVEPTCEGAQDWYDTLDPDGEILTSFSTALSSDSRTSARFDAIDTIDDRAEAISDLEYPDCVEEPREWYLAGLDSLTEALSLLVDEEFGDYVVKQIQAMQQIGQFRGYLMALGVEVKTPENAVFFLQ